MELICPAGTPAAFRAVVDAGADAVYCGFADETNARNFPGLNFSREELAEAASYARSRQVKTLVAVNTFPRAGALDLWHRAVDDAVALGADALILADIGLIDYAARTHPDQRLHLSVQAAAASVDSIRFFTDTFGIKRVVLPRVLSVAEIAAINSAVDCETEVFVFGGLCVMEEGRCSLSSYVTGKSPNMNGVCSPASHVTYQTIGGAVVSRLGPFTINRFESDESAAYPTLCKGRFCIAGTPAYTFEDPVSLDAAAILPAFRDAGVSALKIEGRQRGRAYAAKVVRAFRDALTALDAGLPVGEHGLAAVTEGQSATAGAYRKTWR